MKTRKILLVTTDKELAGIVKISALTLTKLNCQVEIDESSEADDIQMRSKEENLDMIIFDADHEKLYIPDMIIDVRAEKGSSFKKIMTVCSGEIERDKFFKAGCDSIMTKEEFKRVVNNILSL